MHDFEIIAATLIMTFLEIISVIILYVIFRGMIEDAIHYFFHCRKFTMERQVFNDTVRVFQPLSIDMILCGNFNLNMENNIVLFRAVHRYIHATKRFKTS